MTKKIEIDAPGPAEAMVWKDVSLPEPDATEVTIRHSYVGLNYIDTYHRTGLYPLPMPSGIGMEGSGVVTKLGKSVDMFKEGDRVAYGLGPPGSYSEERNIDQSKLIKIPDFIGEREASSIMLQGMTVEYLLERTFKVKESHTVLVHAAAGGVGLIMCQWLKSLGAKIIGTAGSSEKAELAKASGCENVINYKDEDFLEKVLDITEGAGVDVVYDGVGKDTALKSLACLKDLGMLVIFGNSSGNSPPIDPTLLAKKSLFLTRPTLMTYCASRENMVMSANRVFSFLKEKKINVNIGKEYLLSDVVEAHIDLESRNTTGSIILKNDY